MSGEERYHFVGRFPGLTGCYSGESRMEVKTLR
jgi:hypothetical protein